MTSTMPSSTRSEPRGRRPNVAETIDKYMSPTPHTIGRDQTLAKAHEMMREHGVRHLPVLDGGKLIGVVSDRDLKFVQSLKDVDPKKVPVEQAMTDEPFTVALDAKIEPTVREMVRKKYGCAIVMSDGKVVGIFTTIDALQALAWVLDLLDDD